MAFTLIDPAIALAAFGGFGVIYIFILGFTHAQMQQNGRGIVRESTRRIKTIQEGQGGIRDRQDFTSRPLEVRLSNRKACDVLGATWRGR